MAGRVDELRKRLASQPDSRLFAQLAEELRKEGQLEESIRVCRDGLRRHPAYASAHMTLGRALFDKRDLAAARVEFESVVSGAPDNILAGRLLGECLEGLGEVAAARQRYQTTLTLSPDDSQLTSRLAKLPAPRSEAADARSLPPEGMRRAATQAVVAAAVASAKKDAAPGGDAPGAAGQAAEAEAAAPEAAAAPQPPRPAAAPEEPIAVPATEGSRIEVGGAAAGAPQDEPPEATPGTIPFERRPVQPAPLKPTSRTLPIGTPAPRIVGGAPTAARRRADTRPVTVESVRRALEGGARPSAPASTPAAPEPPRSRDGELATPTLAELYLKQGHLQKALEVYQAILEREPDNYDLRSRAAALVERVREQATRRDAVRAAIARLEALLVSVQAAGRA